MQTSAQIVADRASLTGVLQQSDEFGLNRILIDLGSAFQPVAQPVKGLHYAHGRATSPIEFAGCRQFELEVPSI
jgi:hypothetical protein